MWHSNLYMIFALHHSIIFGG